MLSKDLLCRPFADDTLLRIAGSMTAGLRASVRHRLYLAFSPPSRLRHYLSLRAVQAPGWSAWLEVACVVHLLAALATPKRAVLQVGLCCYQVTHTHPHTLTHSHARRRRCCRRRRSRLAPFALPVVSIISLSPCLPPLRPPSLMGPLPRSLTVL